MFMLKEFSEYTRRSAVDGSPAFERFVFSGFPAWELRIDHNIRLKVEGERGLVRKPDVKEEIFGNNVQFDTFHRFASGVLLP